jgi:beta-glucosidase
VTGRWLDADLGVEERVDALTSEMTLIEKCAQLGGIAATSLVGGDGDDLDPDNLDPDLIARRIPFGIGQVTRIGGELGLAPGQSATLLNQIQRVAVERTRLGIPVLVHEESVGGYLAHGATVFPQGIGLASTWDPELVSAVAEVIREQLRAVGARHALAPVLDVARDPRWGRVEETYGENPVLAGVIGTAYVQGLQTGNLRDGILCTGKHFVGHGLSEGGRNHAPVQLGPRELREVYAEPFAAAIRDARLGCVMASYSPVDGLPCAGSAAILDRLLRDELGFDGMVVADYFAVGFLETRQRTAADKREAAVQALTAGLDLELPELDCYGRPLREAVEAGRVDPRLVDRSVGRVLAAKFRLGLFEQPYVDAASAPMVFDTPAQRLLARRAVARSVVLLANDQGVLPIRPEVGAVAVIGPGADDPRLLQGDYHYPAHIGVVPGDELGRAADDETAVIAAGAIKPEADFTVHVTPRAALREAFAGRAKVLFARGCDVVGDDRSGFGEAIGAARAAEVAVVVIAGRSGLGRECTVGEGRDATDLRPTGVQAELVRAVHDTGTPTVAVVLSGRVHALEEVAEAADALVQLWPPGEEGGHGLVDVLLGLADPAGRLPVTLPRNVGQVPLYAGHRAAGASSFFYHDYSDSPVSPLFAFGHGLGYTTFTYGELRLDAGGTTDPIQVSVAVTNDGTRAGEEVVQLYAVDLVASVARPDRQLVGFARVPFEPGQTRIVRFTVHPSRLAFYDSRMRFVCEPGDYSFRVGASSVDIRAETTIRLTGSTVTYQQREIVATTVIVA